MLSEHCHILADGRRLAWREAGAGAPLVLLHGWTMSSRVFAEVAARLADRFRVLAPDLRGHGDSDPGEGYALEQLAGDLRAWLAALELERIGLLGWSLGGQTALQLATGSDLEVERLVLVGTTPRFTSGPDWQGGLPPTQVKAMARNLRRDYRRTLEEFFHLQFVGEELPRARLRTIAGFAVRPGRLPEPEVALAALETLASADQRPLPARLAMPTLVVHGREDRIVPVAAGRFLAEALPQGRLVELPGIGHAPFLSQPEAMAALWREFLT